MKISAYILYFLFETDSLHAWFSMDGHIMDEPSFFAIDVKIRSFMIFEKLMSSWKRWQRVVKLGDGQFFRLQLLQQTCKLGHSALNCSVCVCTVSINELGVKLMLKLGVSEELFPVFMVQRFAQQVMLTLSFGCQFPQLMVLGCLLRNRIIFDKIVGISSAMPKDLLNGYKLLSCKYPYSQYQ